MNKNIKYLKINPRYMIFPADGRKFRIKNNECSLK